MAGAVRLALCSETGRPARLLAWLLAVALLMGGPWAGAGEPHGAARTGAGPLLADLLGSDLQPASLVSKVSKLALARSDAEPGGGNKGVSAPDPGPVHLDYEGVSVLGWAVATGPPVPCGLLDCGKAPTGSE